MMIDVGRELLPKCFSIRENPVWFSCFLFHSFVSFSSWLLGILLVTFDSRKQRESERENKTAEVRCRFDNIFFSMLLFPAAINVRSQLITDSIKWRREENKTKRNEYESFKSSPFPFRFFNSVNWVRHQPKAIIFQICRVIETLSCPFDCSVDLCSLGIFWFFAIGLHLKFLTHFNSLMVEIVVVWVSIKSSYHVFTVFRAHLNWFLIEIWEIMNFLRRFVLFSFCLHNFECLADDNWKQIVPLN